MQLYHFSKSDDGYGDSTANNSVPTEPKVAKLELFYGLQILLANIVL